MAISQTLLLEAASLHPSAIVDLFHLDLTKQGGIHVYFYPGNTYGNVDIFFKGIEYAAWPVQTSGFEWTTSGTQPRPTISFSNVLGTFTQLNQQFNGCIGCQIIRTRTFARFLDYMPGADSTAHFPSEMWVINRKTDENRVSCTYELANPMDFEDLLLPRRRVLADLCQWDYRGQGCGYTGDVLADANDVLLPVYYGRTWHGYWSPFGEYYYGAVVQMPYEVPQLFVAVYPTGGKFGNGQIPPEIGNSNYWKRDECSLRLSGCRMRFGIITYTQTIQGYPIASFTDFFTSETGQSTDPETAWKFWYLHGVLKQSLTEMVTTFEALAGFGPSNYEQVTQFNYATGVPSMGPYTLATIREFWANSTQFSPVPSDTIAWQLYEFANLWISIPQIFENYLNYTGTPTTNLATAVSVTYNAGQPMITGVPMNQAAFLYTQQVGSRAPNPETAFKLYYMLQRGISVATIISLANQNGGTAETTAAKISFIYAFERYPEDVPQVTTELVIGAPNKQINVGTLDAYWRNSGIQEALPGNDQYGGTIKYKFYILAIAGYNLYTINVVAGWLGWGSATQDEKISVIYNYLKQPLDITEQFLAETGGIPPFTLALFWQNTVGGALPSVQMQYKLYYAMAIAGKTLPQVSSIATARGIGAGAPFQYKLLFTYQFLKAPSDIGPVTYTPYPAVPARTTVAYPAFPGIVTTASPPGPLPFGGFPGTRETPITSAG